ncbi:restriction endonuclease subunit R [Haemophilus quentini]|uniref:Restriction endonuclease subunit R n=1 Tax=Haemophilus quentini TaxID=123834 RepID=A0ABX3BQM9_9PAST|nr:type I restriction endonuclease [Haemophilus quentini]EGT79927.1 type I site-specific deoxyribonuclease restriction subunit [Haemophilus haemolyticus M21639]OEY76702.1 restriction endonuclease subunit R [Haemophilus quentini]OEY77575.1 restriction endonuclease subunit R [Haemophilus quentini]ORC39392.1 restriction endonuclease subunit R [Haemophilus quentini]
MHTEQHFENEIEHSLLTEGGYQQGLAKDYEKSTALFPADAVAFIQTTQPKLWDRLEMLFKDKAQDELIKALNQELNIKGSLNVLRNGFRVANRTAKMAYFAPNSTLNETSQQQYDANIVKITRQVITEYNERIDMVISVNGIPVSTIELKNEMSATGWTVEDAKYQYRKERNPQGKLFEFKKRALVHFAVDTQEVYMTTKLEGENTRFLPFNRGFNDGKGNPPVENDVRTAYLWREVLRKDSLMELIGRFLHLSREERKIRTDSGFRYITSESMIFPRFHQLDAVRKLIAHTKTHGAGKNYLIQHSAGSGKSNTIAWLAHHLASLHNADDEKIFNSVIIVTDRVVLDRQLQETVAQFEQTDGVVQKIDKDTHQLTAALAANVPIIITTIQKFPYVMHSIQTKAKQGEHISLDTEGKRFAVIVDEAHSSQTGETAGELRQVLNKSGIEAAIAAEFLDLDEDEQADIEVQKNILREQFKRCRQDNLSFFAFTATPKWKTLALFDEPNEQGETPFHSYSMKQAIEEGFILDVLANYATYKQYFRLLRTADSDIELPKHKAKKELMRFVNLHTSAISQKVEIIIEHFQSVTRHKIGGYAKAMVVTSSREAAVRYKLAFDEYIAEKGYEGIKSLVAFSGKVILSEQTEKEYSEPSMNGGIKETELPEQFDCDNYQVLLVADKYQTGFDQPLLHTMFVDKVLSGVQAVQTLSRLNRTAKGKEDTFVLDFVNDHEAIYDAFKPYYQRTALGDIPSDEKLACLGNTLDEWKIYTQSDIDEFANIWFSGRTTPTNSDHKKLNAVIDKAIEKYKHISDDPKHNEEQQKLFKSQLQSYLNLYLFVSQILPYADSIHEKRYVYLKALMMKLPRGKQSEKLDLSKMAILQYYRLQQIGEGSIKLNEGEAEPQKGSTDVGTGQVSLTEELDKLIKELNEAFTTEFTLADQLFFESVEKFARENPDIVDAANNNPLSSFMDYFNTRIDDLLVGLFEQFGESVAKVLNNPQIKHKVCRRLAKQIYENVHLEK